MTIAAAVALSGLVSLTLTPALCALWLKKSEERQRQRWWHKPVDWFNSGLAWLQSANGRAVEWLSGRLWTTVGSFAAILGAVVVLLLTVPSGFVPLENEGYLFTDMQLPKGASLHRTEQEVGRIGR